MSSGKSPVDGPCFLVVICHLPQFSAAVLEYSRKAAELAPRFGGEYIMHGGPSAVLEGEWSPRMRLVISRWPDRSALESFWNSPDYQQHVKPLRTGTGLYDVAVFPDIARAISPLSSSP